MEPKIYDFTDYRDYLKSWYAWKKKNGKISHRIFSKNAGFSAPNVLKLVMEGSRNLSEESLPKFANALGLNKSEFEFFKHLVALTQGKNLSQKAFHEKKLVSTRRIGSTTPLEAKQHWLYSAWYFPVIYEMLSLAKIEKTPLALAQKLRFRVTTAQIEKALRVMEKLGLVKSNKNGAYAVSAPYLTTGDETRSATVLNYHVELLEAAKSLFPAITAEERDISSLTFAVPKSLIPELKELTRKFRKDVIHKIASSDKPADAVYLLNVQLFPVTV